MLELAPQSNLVVRIDADDPQSVRDAFRVLECLCDTLAQASRIMRSMPGNEPVPDARGEGP